MVIPRNDAKCKTSSPEVNRRVAGSSPAVGANFILIWCNRHSVEYVGEGFQCVMPSDHRQTNKKDVVSTEKSAMVGSTGVFRTPSLGSSPNVRANFRTVANGLAGN